jgi:ketosteroid isomerase-like protein
MRRRLPGHTLTLAVLLIGCALPGTRLRAQTGDSLRARISAIATAEGFEPATALALVAIESAFDTAAVGKGGPLGLMQIKLGTAAAIMPGVTRSDLFNPETNVRVGLRYLQSLMDLHHGDLETALRAYKGGPRAVVPGKAPTSAVKRYLERFRRAQERYAADAAVAAIANTDTGGAAVRSQLVKLYDLNASAVRGKDLAAVMALRAPDFHTIAADSTRRDRVGMEQYMQGIMNGIREWQKIEFTIDSLRVSGDTAYAVVTQHLNVLRNQKSLVDGMPD